MTEEIILNKLKKGDKISLRGDEYEVLNFNENYFNDEKVVEIELVKKNMDKVWTENKIKQSGKQKFIFSYNNKTGEKKLSKMVIEKNVSLHGFYESKETYFSYNDGGTI